MKNRLWWSLQGQGNLTSVSKGSVSCCILSCLDWRSAVKKDWDGDILNDIPACCSATLASTPAMLAPALWPQPLPSWAPTLQTCSWVFVTLLSTGLSLCRNFSVACTLAKDLLISLNFVLQITIYMFRSMFVAFLLILTGYQGYTLYLIRIQPSVRSSQSSLMTIGVSTSLWKFLPNKKVVPLWDALLQLRQPRVQMTPDPSSIESHSCLNQTCFFRTLWITPSNS